MLVLPKSSTVTVETDVNGVKEKLPLNTVIAEIAPNLTTPTIISLIANTSAVDTSKFADIEYRAIAKSQPTVSYVDGKLVVDQAGADYKTLEVNPVRLKPTEIIDKYKINDIDTFAGQDFEKALADQVINFNAALETNNEMLAFNNMAYAAQEAQKKIVADTAGATTFAKGAHVEVKTLATADEVYDAISKAKTVIKRIGKENAKTNYDKNFKYAFGIDLSNVVLLINDEVLDLLLSKQGVFASDSGLEVFKSRRIVSVLGLTCIPTSNLPDGCQFMITTIGKMGALGYTKLGVGDWFKFGDDPEWELNKVLKCARHQVLGVLYDSLILASFEDGTTINYKDTYGKVRASTRILNEDEVFEINKSKSKFKEAVENIKEKITDKKQETTETK